MFEHTYRRQSAPAVASRAYAPTSLPSLQLDPTYRPEANATQIRILIVDDHTVVRNGIAFSLLAFSDLDVVAQAGSGEEAMRCCVDADVPPDVVLMDLMMPGMGGIAAIQALRAANPEIQIVVLTSFQEGNLVEDALQAGAIGYLLKDVAVDELAKAIRLAQHGVPVLAPAAAQALVHAAVRRPPPLGQDLTKREREVLELMAKGLTNRQIAHQLIVTPATIKFHTRSIRSKLGTTSRTETVVLALQYHLVSGGSGNVSAARA